MSYNEFHKGKLHKLTRGMSETENKVKELTNNMMYHLMKMKI